MANLNFQNLVQKVMNDASFADELIQNPRSALQSVGIEPTAEVLDALKGVDPSAIRKLAVAFKEDQAAAG